MIRHQHLIIYILPGLQNTLFCLDWSYWSSFSLHLTGCEAEVPLGSGWGHGQAGWTGEEDRQGCGGVQAVLGGPPVGQTGKSTVVEKYRWIEVFFSFLKQANFCVTDWLSWGEDKPTFKSRKFKCELSSRQRTGSKRSLIRGDCQSSCPHQAKLCKVEYFHVRIFFHRKHCYVMHS